MTCSGNSNEICGGYLANSVYLTFDSCRKHFNNFYESPSKKFLLFFSSLSNYFLQFPRCFLQIPCIFREIPRKKYRKFNVQLRRFDEKFLVAFWASFGLFSFE